MKTYFCDRCPTQLPNPRWEWEGADDSKKFTVKVTVRREDGDYADLCEDCLGIVIEQATFLKVSS